MFYLDGEEKRQRAGEAVRKAQALIATTLAHSAEVKSIGIDASYAVDGFNASGLKQRSLDAGGNGALWLEAREAKGATPKLTRSRDTPSWRTSERP